MTQPMPPRHGDLFYLTAFGSTGTGYGFVKGTEVQFITSLDRDGGGRDCVVRPTEAGVKANGYGLDKQVYVLIDSRKLEPVPPPTFVPSKFYATSDYDRTNHHHRRNGYVYEIIDVKGDLVAAWAWRQGDRITATVLRVQHRPEYKEVNSSAG